MKISKEIKELAKEIHKAEHLFVSKKIDKNHKLEEYYYLMGALVLKKVTDEIKDSNVEIFNKIVDLEKRFNSIESSMKEVSKQQKYLWQTQDDALHENSEEEEQ